MNVIIDAGPQQGWTRGQYYALQSDGSWLPGGPVHEHCGEKTDPGYGLGAPCGGFATYNFCLMCGRFVGVFPLPNEED